jgi:hypothetical protein
MIRVVVERAMWSRVRWWKHVIVPPLLALGVILMPGDPDDAPVRSVVASAILGVLALGYCVEEVIWGVRGRGRPCPHCGRLVRMKSFRVALACPACGKPV